MSDATAARMARSAGSGRTRRLAVVLGISSMVVAACGDSGSSSSSAAGAGGAAAATGTINIGLITDGSGGCQSPDSAAQKGVEIAVDQLNKAGIQIGGTSYQVKLTEADAASDNTKAVAAMNKLVHDDNLKFVVGPGCGAYVEPGLGPVAVKSNVMFLNPSPLPALEDPTKAPDAIKTDAKYIFATQPNVGDSGYGQAAILTMFPDFAQIKKAFLLMQNDAGGRGFGGAMKKWMDDKGLTTQIDFYDPGTTDFSGFLSKVKDFGADVLVAGYTEQSALAILKQDIAVNAAPRYYGYGQDLTDALKNATGSPITVPSVFLVYPRALLYPTTPAVQQLADAFKVKVGGDLAGSDSSYAAYLVDLVPLLVNAMKQAGTIDDLDKISAALSSAHFKGVLGDDMNFDSNHRLHFNVDGCLVNAGQVTCKPFPT